MKNVFAGIIIILLFGACNSSKQAMGSATTAEITASIDSGNWVFKPIRMMPQSGISRDVFGGYFATYNTAELSVYLPYYGTAYSGADVMSTKGPTDFVSKDFTINKKLAKEGKWEIRIDPKDIKEVQFLIFSFYSNGSADLSVSLYNRSPIRYTGTIEPIKN
ncbi:MAG: DUF4251 domain-containing protein [Bacteroidota bacterium]